jgi:large subunit ribosomal protein L10
VEERPVNVKTQKINARKQDAVGKIKAHFEDVENLIFTDFRGLNVPQITELRNTLRDNEADYRVLKNNYTKIAMQELGLPDASEFLFGPTAVAMIKSDPGSVAKVIANFARDSSVKIKGGLIGGRILSFEEVKVLSDLPSRDQLLAMLLGAMKAPVQNLASGLNGLMQKLVLTIKAVGDKKAQEAN